MKPFTPFDEECSRVDDELRRTEVRWPKPITYCIAAAGGALVWVSVVGLYRLFS